MWKKRLNSFRYAFTGIATLFRSETNAKIHLLAAVSAVFAGVFFSITLMEWCFLILVIALVFAAEGFNTALEKLTDLVSPEFHPLAGQAKDLAAGAVLFIAIAAFIIGLIIFLPKFLSLINP